MPDHSPDPWARLRAATPARIGLGRSGDSLSHDAVLALQLDHARARVAVTATLDIDALALGGPVLRVRSQATDRTWPSCPSDG